MKRCALLLGCVVLLVGASASGQTKISGSLKCGKSDEEHAFEVGDAPGHVLKLQKGTCQIAMQPIEGEKATAYSWVSRDETTSTRITANGYGVMTMESGDKIFGAFQGTVKFKDGKPPVEFPGTWSYTGGTGKFKGIKGKGTFKEIDTEDGGSTVEFANEYQVPASTR
jgi:hypothetical protein